MRQADTVLRPDLNALVVRPAMGQNLPHPLHTLQRTTHGIGSAREIFKLLNRHARRSLSNLAVDPLVDSVTFPVQGNAQGTAWLEFGGQASSGRLGVTCVHQNSDGENHIETR